MMLPGDQPENFDEVIAEAEKRMTDTVNAKLNVSFVPFSDLSKLKVTLQSGENIDLIFDAPWVALSQNIAQVFYVNLESNTAMVEVVVLGECLAVVYFPASISADESTSFANLDSLLTSYHFPTIIRYTEYH